MNIFKALAVTDLEETPHGVLNDSGNDRYSIAFFYSPNVHAVIECLPSCVGTDHPPRYAPAVYGDLVLEFYRSNYFHQRGYASAQRGRGAPRVPRGAPSVGECEGPFRGPSRSREA